MTVVHIPLFSSRHARDIEVSPSFHRVMLIELQEDEKQPKGIISPSFPPLPAAG